jgi:hypothetical protein
MSAKRASLVARGAGVCCQNPTCSSCAPGGIAVSFAHLVRCAAGRLLSVAGAAGAEQRPIGTGGRLVCCQKHGFAAVLQQGLLRAGNGLLRCKTAPKAHKSGSYALIFWGKVPIRRKEGDSLLPNRCKSGAKAVSLYSQNRRKVVETVQNRCKTEAKAVQNRAHNRCKTGEVVVLYLGPCMQAPIPPVLAPIKSMSKAALAKRLGVCGRTLRRYRLRWQAQELEAGREVDLRPRIFPPGVVRRFLAAHE